MRALISVSDKTGVVELARALHERGVEVISTGGTAMSSPSATSRTVPALNWKLIAPVRRVSAFRFSTELETSKGLSLIDCAATLPAGPGYTSRSLIASTGMMKMKSSPPMWPTKPSSPASPFTTSCRIFARILMTRSPS